MKDKIIGILKNDSCLSVEEYKGQHRSLSLDESYFNDVAEEIVKLFAIPDVMPSFAIVRWYDNSSEDVVCTTKEVAKEYVKKYNKLAGKEECYLDEDVFIPLNKA